MPSEPSERLTRLLGTLDERLRDAPKATCVACGHSQWLWFEQIPVLPIGPGRAYEVLTYACAHCGWLRLHSCEVLESADEIDASEPPRIH